RRIGNHERARPRHKCCRCGARQPGTNIMKSKRKPVSRPNKSVKKPAANAKKAPKKVTIGVLIADDHSVVREGLVSLIGRKADMTVVGEASNGREAVD